MIAQMVLDIQMFSLLHALISINLVMSSYVLENREMVLLFSFEKKYKWSNPF